VDIDLTYLPINERGFALDDITHALIRVSKEMRKKVKKLLFAKRVIL